MLEFLGVYEVGYCVFSDGFFVVKVIGFWRCCGYYDFCFCYVVFGWCEIIIVCDGDFWECGCCVVGGVYIRILDELGYWLF